MQQALPPAILFVPVLALWLAALSAPTFRSFADDQPRRFVTIDGLRGLLAVSVFAHHFSITAQWQRIGRWELTPSPAWNAMGHAAVTLFFMITGFLFFGKIAGPARRLDLVAFFKGRLLRIYPVYLVCLVLAAVFALAMPDRFVTPAAAARSVLWWLAFCPTQLFAMSGAGLIVAHAPWSLRYEWCFYLALPLIAWAWRRCELRPFFVAALCLASLALAQCPLRFVHPPLELDTRYIAPFMLGGATWVLVRDGRFGRIARGPVGSATALLALAVIFTRGTPYSVETYLTLSIAFVPIAAGASLFGVLESRAMLILGAISYDVYLLHGIVLFALFHIVAPLGLIDVSVGVFASWLFAAGTAVIAFALATHRFVEVPAMSMSMRLRAADPRERLAAP